MTTSADSADNALATAPTGFLVTMMTIACGVIAAGSYLAQPLVSTIAHQIGLPAGLAGLAVTLSQIGYCIGLLFIAPLADLVENRRLLFCMMFTSIVSMLLCAVAQNGWLFLLACSGIGMSSASVQMIVSMAVRLSPASSRGKVVGRVTGGLLTGILLAWPLATVIGNALGWRALFMIEALLVALLALGMWRYVPIYRPNNHHRYRHILSSMWPLWLQMPELRTRALLQALLFGVFSMIWTLLPMILREQFAMSTSSIALFGLAGAAGALSAPFAGSMADKGKSKRASRLAIIAVFLGCLTLINTVPLWVFLVGVIAIDGGVQMSHVVSQRRVLSLIPEASNRLNSLYISTFFLGGAVGSAIAIPLYHAQHHLPGIVGIGCGVLAFLLVMRLRSNTH